MGDFVRASLIFAAILVLAPVGASLANVPATQEPAFRPDLLYVDGRVDGRTLADAEHLPSPETSHGIGPGSRIFLTRPDGMAMCTANFIWTDGADLYLGTAGHCVVPAGFTATHGAGADYDAALTDVSVCVSECDFGGQMSFLLRGTLVHIGPATYGRQADAVTGNLFGNDFGLIRIPPALYAYVHTEMPVWGGPSVGNTPASITGVPICLYGHGMIVSETYHTQAKIGVGQEIYPNVGRYQALIGAEPGDSGAPVVTCGPDADGIHGIAALGIHTHSSYAPYLPVKAGTTVTKAKAMVARDYGATISVVLGS